MVCDNVIGLVFSSCQTFSCSGSGTFYVKLCLFSVISTVSNGGAVYISSSSSNSVFNQNTFVECVTTKVGGGIYIHSGYNLNISECCFSDCQALDSQVHYSYVQKHNFWLVTSQKSSPTGLGNTRVIYLYGGVANVDDINVSYCRLKDYDAIDIRSTSNSLVKFSTFASNIISLVCEFSDTNARCNSCNIVNNTEPVTNWGLFYSFGSNKLTVTSCVIKSNTFANLISGSAVFSQCILYSNSFTTSATLADTPTYVFNHFSSNLCKAHPHKTKLVSFMARRVLLCCLSNWVLH